MAGSSVRSSRRMPANCQRRFLAVVPPRLVGGYCVHDCSSSSPSRRMTTDCRLRLRPRLMASTTPAAWRAERRPPCCRGSGTAVGPSLTRSPGSTSMTGRKSDRIGAEYGNRADRHCRTSMRCSGDPASGMSRPFLMRVVFKSSGLGISGTGRTPRARSSQWYGSPAWTRWRPSWRFTVFHAPAYGRGRPDNQDHQARRNQGCQHRQHALGRHLYDRRERNNVNGDIQDGGSATPESHRQRALARGAVCRNVGDLIDEQYCCDPRAHGYGKQHCRIVDRVALQPGSEPTTGMTPKPIATASSPRPIDASRTGPTE